MNSSKQFTKMFAAQVKMTFREKQTLFWGLFFPVILMVLFMVIFSGGSDEFKAKIAVVESHPNETSQMLLNQIKQIPVFEMKSAAPVSREQADAWIIDKEVNAVIVLPENASDTSLLLIVNKENEQGAVTQAISGILDKFIQQANLIAAGALPTYELQFESISEGNEDIKYEPEIFTA